MSVYRNNVESTHSGKSKGLECNAVIACRGFGEVVETAKITVKRS